MLKNETIDFGEGSSIADTNESKEHLCQIFPNVKEEILLDFLLKYNNDISTVTHILLDSISFGEISNKKEEIEERENKFQVKSLQSLCVDAMEKLELDMEDLYENNHTNEFIKNLILDESISTASDEASFKSEKKSEHFEYEEYAIKTEQVELIEEPLFSLKMSDNLLSSLIRIFGSEEELKYLDGILVFEQ